MKKQLVDLLTRWRGGSDNWPGLNGVELLGVSAADDIGEPTSYTCTLLFADGGRKVFSATKLTQAIYLAHAYAKSEGNK